MSQKIEAVVRPYSVTVDAEPYERSDGHWVIGEVRVRVCFQCSSTTHVLCWPDACAFVSAVDASRAAYLESMNWARGRYD